MSILKNYISDYIISDEKVKLSTSGIYCIPSEDNLAGLKKYIDTLPNVEDPEIFGMHENTNIAFEQQESQKMFDTILSI